VHIKAPNYPQFADLCSSNIEQGQIYIQTYSNGELFEYLFVALGYQFNITIDAFSIPANVTQQRYGTRSIPARFIIVKNSRIVTKILIQRNIMSINAIPGKCRPKKTIDHKVLSISCKANHITSEFDLLSLFFLLINAKNRAYPIIA
jgi:hypothetical protein